MLNKVSQNREVNASQRWFLGQPRNELTGTAQAGLAAWEAECRRASESGEEEEEEEEDTRRKRTGPGRGTLLLHPILSHGPKACPSILSPSVTQLCAAPPVLAAGVCGDGDTRTVPYSRIYLSPSRPTGACMLPAGHAASHRLCLQKCSDLSFLSPAFQSPSERR